MRLRFWAGLLLFGIFCSQVNAQSGWDYIRKNDHRKAKEAFETALAKDSMNIEAVSGMVFLCEVQDNQEGFRKYANRLVKKDWNEHYFRLFPVNESSEKILKNASLSEAAKMSVYLAKAQNLKYNRKFNESTQIYRDHFSFLEWSYIGPFDNINGYGHVMEYPVEKEAFSTAAVYPNTVRNELKWVTPSLTNKQGFIDFSTHLQLKEEGTYYAQAFFEYTGQEPLELRISRRYPCKIWLDDQLVFEKKDLVNFQWDFEQVQLNPAAGKHRILVKYAIGEYYTGAENGGSSFSFANLLASIDWENMDELALLSMFTESGQGEEGLVIRLTDVNGKPSAALKALRTEDGLAYLTQPLSSRLREKETMLYFREQITNNPDDWFAYFCYYQAAVKAGLTYETEEFFYRAWEKNPESVFFKYLAGMVLKHNGKNEKSDRVLSQINMRRTPVMQLLRNELKEIDRDNEPEDYLHKLQQMHEVSPSNLQIIRQILHFYRNQGQTAESKAFAREIVKKYPRYKTSLEEYLEDNYKPTDSRIGNKREYNSKKDEKEAAKHIRKYYSTDSYEKLINKYKGENNPAKALSYYDEILQIDPDDADTRQSKAEYLFNLNRQQEAIRELHIILGFKPYDNEIYELLGDIYADQKDNPKALEYYHLAKKLSGGSSGYFWGSGKSLDQKISRLSGTRQLRNKFQTLSIEEMRKDESWKTLYPQEESVVVGYTTDLLYEADGSVHMYSRMLIHIQTEAGAASWTQFNFNFMGNLTLAKVVKKDSTEVLPDRSGSFVVFKNLEPGDYIRLEAISEWTSESELGREFNLFLHLFSLQAPIHYAKFEMGVPEGTPLNYQGHRIATEPQIKTEDGFDFYRWESRQIPKIVEEEAIVDAYDIFSILQLTTVKDWSPVVNWYMAKTYRKTEPNYELTTLRDSIIKPGMTDSAKVVAIYNYITKEINYSFTPLLQSNYIPKNTDLTLSARIGDCKDVSTLMISLLQSVGIEAYFVLVKTNQYFHMKTLPGLLFDHVIAGYELNGKTHYVDLTTNYYPYYALNENDIEAWALRIKPGETELFQLPADHLDPHKNKVVHEIKAHLNKDKSLDLEIASVFPGLEGGHMREIHYNKSKDNFTQELLNRMGKGIFENLNVEESEFSNLPDFTEPLEGRFKMKSYSYSDHILNIHFLRIPFMTGVRSSTVISGSKRFNDIDLTEITPTSPTLQKITLTFAEGTTLAMLPKDVHIDNEFGTYRLTFKKINANTLYIEKYQQFYISKIAVADFERFKAFYLDLLEKDRTKIAINVK